MQEDKKDSGIIEEYLLKLASETDTSRMLDLVAETAARLVGAETLAVPLLSPDNTLVRYEYVHGKHRGVLRGLELPIENSGICGWVIENRKPLLSLDLLEDPRVKKELVMEMGINCAVVVPLIARDRIIGGISAFNKADGLKFSDEDTAILTRFANFAAVAVDNAKLMEELKKAAHHNELILDSAGEGIYGLNTEGKVTFVNPAAARMLGWDDREELVGRESHRTWHHKKADGSDYLAEECPFIDVVKNGRIFHMAEEVFWRKDGRPFPVEFTCIPIKDEGNIVGAVVTFKDISERKQAEEEIRKKVSDLERFSKLTVGRELRIIEMKKEVARLKKELSEMRDHDKKSAS